MRQPIYERGHLDPVVPEAKVHLDPMLRAEYSDGYRHLASLQA